MRRFKLRDTLDPISLKDMDESNEWLTGRTEEEFVEDQSVFDGEDLTWGDVARASGVEEENFNLRSRGSRAGERAAGPSSGSNHASCEREAEIDEEDDEGYKSSDREDAYGPLDYDEDEDEY